MTTSTQGNNILVQLTLDKLENVDPSNVGFWFDKIQDGLNAANEQMYEIIYAAILESGQRQIKLGNGENKDLTTLKKIYIRSKSGNKSESLYFKRVPGRQVCFTICSGIDRNIRNKFYDAGNLFFKCRARKNRGNGGK